ncbi:MAG: hypothetical protein JXO48_00550 [Deltaproteobacteria bacterium]|nr:hypothetical protein [Deltaproteobacteria bacterium]
MQKKMLIITLITLLIVSVAVVVQADRRGWRDVDRYDHCAYYGSGFDSDDDYGRGWGNMGPGMMSQGWSRDYDMMGPGWRYGDREEYLKFLDETSSLRKELQAKRFDYQEALRNSDTKPEDMGKLEKEMYALEQKISSRSPRGCWWQRD